MGFFDWFGKKGTPVDHVTVVKRMSASKRDFEGIALDEEGHPVDVFECGDIAVTQMGKTQVKRLYPCRDSLSAVCLKIKKRQATVFYITPDPFTLEFGWRNGGGVKMTVRLERSAASSLGDWLLVNVKVPGENVSAETFGKLMQGKFASDQPLPDWLVVVNREDVAKVETPEPPPSLSVADLKKNVVVFDHFRIERELGGGGQGMVFLATDTQTVVEQHRKVVLKVLRLENCGDAASMEEFVKEANTLADFRDDRIATCYWCRRLGDAPILAMEYVEGDSLDKYLAKQRRGTLSEVETRELLRPIAEALDSAHERGIYHRDVKPQNIIVRTTPKRVGKNVIRTCLLDFGIASRDQADMRQTSFWSVRGTLQYMSPEQKMIGRRPSASMDVYSLAVTAYECLTGNMPYPDGWDRSAKPTPLSSNSPFARAVMRGLEMLPENRPSTCIELIDPPSVVAPPPPPPPQTPPSPQTPPLQPQSQSPRSSPPPNVVSSLPRETPRPDLPGRLGELKRPIELYRTLLAQSAFKCERNGDSARAQWMRDRQAQLRDLSKDLSCADEMELVRFFEMVTAYRRTEKAAVDDFFPAMDRRVELKESLPKTGGAAWFALKESIS